MYGIPATTDLSFLQGKCLTQVCFGPYDLQLHFAEEATSISIQSSVGYGSANGTYSSRAIPKESSDESDVLKDPGFLLGLLMKEIVDVSWTESGTLTLIFTGDVRLQVYDDSKHYESYTINHQKQLFII